MRYWDIRIEYRTKSGCNAKDVQIPREDAAFMDDAMRLARKKVARMRGVIRIDRCVWINSGGNPAGGWPKLTPVD